MSAYNFGGSGRTITKPYQGTWLEAGVIKWTLILQGVPPTKFGRAKMSKIGRDFWQVSHLIANVSETRRPVENLNSTWSTTFHPLLNEKKWWTLVHWPKSYRRSCWHTQLLFPGDYNSSIRGRWPLKFLHTLQLPKMYLKSDMGHRAASCWALPHISSFTSIS